jgi:hypothetical protein
MMLRKRSIHGKLLLRFLVAPPAVLCRLKIHLQLGLLLHTELLRIQQLVGLDRARLYDQRVGVWRLKRRVRMMLLDVMMMVWWHLMLVLVLLIVKVVQHVVVMEVVARRCRAP